MTLASNKSEPTLTDATGEVLHEYDDVILLQAIPVTGKGTANIEMIEAGTRATIISILEQEADLECYVSPSVFAFGTGVPRNMKIVQRREEKFKNA